MNPADEHPVGPLVLFARGTDRVLRVLLIRQHPRQWMLPGIDQERDSGTAATHRDLTALAADVGLVALTRIPCHTKGHGYDTVVAGTAYAAVLRALPRARHGAQWVPLPLAFADYGLTDVHTGCLVAAMRALRHDIEGT